MADSKAKNSGKKPAIKKQQTVRERTQASTEPRRRRVRRTAGRVASPVGRLFGRIRLPDNRFGRILRRIGRIIFPGFLRNSWNEIRQVTWPDARETARLTLAVFIFAVVFAAIVGVLDYGLGKLFREVVIGE